MTCRILAQGLRMTSASDTLEDYYCWTTAQVDPVISPLLQRVLKARPHDVASFAAQALCINFR